MLLTTQIRFFQQEMALTREDGATMVLTTLTLQQWFDPEPLKGELIGEWRDVPVTSGPVKAAVAPPSNVA